MQMEQELNLLYMYWKETGDISVWKGIAQDALIMNIDDLLCVEQQIIFCFLLPLVEIKFDYG
jgi:hypothetical protein